MTIQIGKKRKAGEDSTEETQKVKEITDKIAETEKEVEATRVQRDAKLKKIGNILSDTCIIDKNEVVHTYSEQHIGQQRRRVEVGRASRDDEGDVLPPRASVDD